MSKSKQYHVEKGYIENNIMILSKPTMDLFLKQKKPSDLISLYMFYYYTAKWQKTNQPKATTSYAAKGLKWSKDKIRRIKKKLIDLHLIEDIKSRDENNKITGWYIKLRYLWGENATNDVIENSHPQGFPEGGKSQRVENEGTNALSVNNLNALSVNNKIHIKEKAGMVFNYYKRLTDKNRITKIPKQLTARLKEGFTKEECIKVILYKYLQWWDNEKMRDSVNLVTLFRPSHFEEYLAQAEKGLDMLLKQKYEEYAHSMFEKYKDIPKAERIKMGVKILDYKEWREGYINGTKTEI